MDEPEFDITSRFSSKAAAPAPRWAGFPQYNFVGGHNDPEQIPTEALVEAAAAVLRREGAKLAMYNLSHGAQGYRGLREFVVRKMARRGVACGIDDVLITSGSGQGIELVTQLLVEPGDTVILEEFTYGGAITRMRRLGANIIGAPLDADGIRIGALAKILEDLAARGVVPKFIYTIPTIQNPTGSILPLERRRQLVALARQHGVPIFEDECYADLTWLSDAPPALYSLDAKQVIHIGSFSKSLAPALRVGYVVADWAVLSRLIASKTDGGTGAMDQMVIAEYFSRDFEAHTRKLSAVLGEKLEVMVDSLAREFGTAVEPQRPEGGIFLWMKFPDDVDVRTLVKAAGEAGLVFNPGPEWACDPEAAKSHMRLCFGLASKEQIRAGVATLARVCFEQTGIPVHSANIRNQAAGG